MASHSQFVAECLCGYSLATPDRNSTCPKCHRLIEFEWGNKPQAAASYSRVDEDGASFTTDLASLSSRSATNRE